MRLAHPPREAYKRRGLPLKLNFWQMALRDAFNPPTVHDLDVSGYKRGKGGVLLIRASDDFAVFSARVVLRDAARRIVAKGEATAVQGDWQFTVPPPARGGTVPASVEVAVRDRPGNVTTQVFALP